MTQTIRLLNFEWKYDPESILGEPGGFGTVFSGVSADNVPVAVKRLHIGADRAAHRELRIAEELSDRSLAHVLPVLDAGLDAESDAYYLVMPLAERSLEDEIRAKGTLPQDDAVAILSQLVAGLNELPDIVHRDLKPANVLLHEGQWKIADFGIARFVEESTSLDTLKGALSPHYAAPEQWKLEHATHATDVYALGCIAYTLLTGMPPFDGATFDDIREQHLGGQPPTLEGANPRLRSLVLTMLRKNPPARPSLERIAQVIEALNQTDSSGNANPDLDRLAEAGAESARRDLEVETARQAQIAKDRARVEMAESAKHILSEVVDALFQSVRNAAPNAQTHRTSGGRSIIIGTAALRIDEMPFNPIPEGSFEHSKWDVILGATIEAEQMQPHQYTWGASLWYTDLGQGTDYRWREVFYFSPLSSTNTDEPFALTEIREADIAASNIMGRYSHASKIKAVDDEDTASFIERWAGILANAVQGKLAHPPRLPLD